MPDSGIKLQEEIVMIRVSSAVIDKLIPQICCGVIEKDKLFSLLGIVPFVNNNRMKSNVEYNLYNAEGRSGILSVNEMKNLWRVGPSG